MNLYFWLIVIVSVITIGVMIYLVFYRDIDPMDLCVVFILGGIIQMTISETMESKQPEPIDVYREKTTLKITYIDSIPQDTVVVWKLEGNI